MHAAPCPHGGPGGRVSPKPQQKAQGRGIVAAHARGAEVGLPSIYIKAWVSLEEGLGLGPAVLQTNSDGSGQALMLIMEVEAMELLGWRKKDKKARSGPAPLDGPSPPSLAFFCFLLRFPIASDNFQQEMRPIRTLVPLLMRSLKKILGAFGHIFLNVKFEKG